MLTIYAGPFEENFCMKSVKKEFGRCGPIQSLTVVTETFQVRSTQTLQTGLEGLSKLLERYRLEPKKYQLSCWEGILWQFTTRNILHYELQTFRAPKKLLHTMTRAVQLMCCSEDFECWGSWGDFCPYKENWCVKAFKSQRRKKRVILIEELIEWGFKQLEYVEYYIFYPQAFLYYSSFKRKQNFIQTWLFTREG